MSVYYLDASAAVKGYVAERGSEKVLNLLSPEEGHELYLSRVGVVEIAAALFGRVTADEVSLEDARAAVARLLNEVENTSYRVVELVPATSERAVEVAERHFLRAYGCLQLATALLLQEQRTGRGLEPLTLVSADGRLNAAAEAEGLPVKDPSGGDLQSPRADDADEQQQPQEGGDHEADEAEEANAQEAELALPEDAQDRRSHD